MPMVDEKMDFLRKQVLTSRNVRGNVIVDYALGGLNYQIEHHLFPSMPMPNLRKAQPLVKEYCASVDVKYVDASVVESYGQILSYLHEVGEPLRRQRR
jgi:fatty acid desaturase